MRVEEPFDVGNESLWGGARSVALGGDALAVDEEFCEIPFDFLGAEDSGLAPLEELEEWVCVRAIDFDFLKEGEADGVIALAEGLNFGG